MTSSDSIQNQLRLLIPASLIKNLHHVQTHKGIISIVIEWVAIVGAALICEKFFSWPLYALTLIFIGARLLSLGLIMHEAVHHLLSKNWKLNDFLAEVFCAWPLFISMRSYRIKHLAHHKWLNTEQDPDYISKTDVNWQFPMKFTAFVKMLFVQLTGIGVFETFRVMSGKNVKGKKDKAPVWYTVARILFYVIVVGAFVAFDKWLLLLMYWIIPFATYTQLANRLRRIAEHSAVEGKDLAMETRTTKHNFISRLLLVPKNINYHNEHHLYPGIPCYNLPELHHELNKHPEISAHLYVSDGYTDVFKDVVK